MTIESITFQGCLPDDLKDANQVFFDSTTSEDDSFGIDSCGQDLLEAEEEFPTLNVDRPANLSTVETTEPIALYFREVKAVPLLTREQEIVLAKRIEDGIIATARLASIIDTQRDTDEIRGFLETIITNGKAARKHLIAANGRIVIDIARRYVNQGVPFLDLIQEGNIGLMKAADKFDYRRGNKFSTYATWWIRQAVTRALADQGRTIRVPVHMSDRIRKTYAIVKRLRKDLGRKPTPTEIAMELFNEVTPESIKAIEFILRIPSRPLSLEAPVGEDEESEFGDFQEDDTLQSTDTVVINRDRQECIDLALECLPLREARVLILRYGLYDGIPRTLKEIGILYGVTRERIRQVEKEALIKLRHPRRAELLREYLDL